ncbi:class I glutamine amidotransferase-like protein [Pseudoneurospora amorphoporcata]|uniref:glutaminase n=1 Tax=Pseudoneurospora amorphoporcata TaxID=241081 RepID=A0AAN6SK83_9PEZI|nr:class I glutamine amidotransferase-like protein [Pseudoneurospora amorphoporcata]
MTVDALTPKQITVGVLALQGGVIEHISLLQKAAAQLSSQQSTESSSTSTPQFTFIQVRTTAQLSQCDALIIPGGESTTMAIVARRLGLLDPLREFVKVQHKPTWGTCAGLVMLASAASATKQGGQELIGGLDVKVLRNRYGTQIQSFVGDLRLPFLEEEKPFRGVFIRAPVVEEIMTSGSSASGNTQDGSEAGQGGDEIAKLKERQRTEKVEVLGTYPKPQGTGEGEDIVAVRQGNVFGTSFHPELTDDVRIHVWWLKQVVERLR